MVVNSVRFLFFFIVVFTVYYLPITKKLPRRQNIWLLLASYFFYGVVDWKMVVILVCATAVFYVLGLWLKNVMEKGHMKEASHLTTFGVALGICLLLYFKYLNFFGESITQLLSAVGLKATWTTLNIIVPVGVSFFTFKLISYLIEIHREHIEPCKDMVEFATYVAFFPTLLSGPIDRPNTFLPQLRKSHSLDYAQAVDGCRQILWGMFMKVVVADRMGLYVDTVLPSYMNYTGVTCFAASIFYTVQIYGDFAGYSLMAIGVGKMLGFEFPENFNYPYESRSVTEFWRRWHISLGSWFREYLYIPLGGNRRGLPRQMLNLLIVWGLTGLWHGAGWNFVIWGLYFFVLLAAEKLFLLDKLKKVPAAVGHIYTLIAVLISWVIFACDDIGSAGRYILSMFGTNGFADAASVYYLRENFLIIIAGALLSVSFVRRIIANQVNSLSDANLRFGIKTAIGAGIYLLSLLMVIGSSYNPFLYFRF